MGNAQSGESIQRAMPEIRRQKLFTPAEMFYITNNPVIKNKQTLISRILYELSVLINNQKSASPDDLQKRDLYVKIIKTLIAKTSVQPGTVITIDPELITKIKQTFGEGDYTQTILKELNVTASTTITPQQITLETPKILSMCNAPSSVKKISKIGEITWERMCDTIDGKNVVVNPSLKQGQYGGRRKRSKKSKKSRKQKKSRKHKKTRRHR